MFVAEKGIDIAMEEVGDEPALEINPELDTGVPTALWVSQNPMPDSTTAQPDGRISRPDLMVGSTRKHSTTAFLSPSDEL